LYVLLIGKNLRKDRNFLDTMESFGENSLTLKFGPQNFGTFARKK